MELTGNNAAVKTGSWTRVLKIIIPYIFIAGIFQYAAYLMMGLDITEDVQVKSTWQRFIIILFGSAGTFLTVWLFRKYVDQESVASLGFTKILREDIIAGLLAGFLIMLFGFLALLLSSEIQYVESRFLAPDFILSIGIFIIVALTEELLIRGYVLSNLMGSVNRYAALIISSVIFSLMHAANPSFGWLPALELFVSGVLLGLSYIYTRSLWFPVALHFSWNFFQGTIFGFNVSGNTGYSVINHTREQNNLWNGGSFGFEGSVLSVILQLVCIFIIYMLFRKQSGERTEYNGSAWLN